MLSFVAPSHVHGCGYSDAKFHVHEKKKGDYYILDCFCQTVNDFFALPSVNHRVILFS